jgi:hypothetical protein
MATPLLRAKSPPAGNPAPPFAPSRGDEGEGFGHNPSNAPPERPDTFIVFCLIAHETKILAQATSPIIPPSEVEERKDALKCGQLTEKLLEKISAQLKNNHMKTLNTAAYSFHYIMEDGIIFICAAHPEFEQKIAFGFLRDVKERFQKRFDVDRVRAAKPYEFSDEFQHTLEKKMVYYSTESTEKIVEVMRKLDRVKQTMRETIDRAIRRGEDLSELAWKAKTMEDAGQSFKHVAAETKRKYCWLNFKTSLAFALVRLSLPLPPLSPSAAAAATDDTTSIP